MSSYFVCKKSGNWEEGVSQKESTKMFLYEGATSIDIISEVQLSDVIGEKGVWNFEKNKFYNYCLVQNTDNFDDRAFFPRGRRVPSDLKSANLVDF